MGLEGKKCPNFLADSTTDKKLSNDDFKGKKLIIFFYPKDNTPGCTLEGQDFRDYYQEFKKLGSLVKQYPPTPIPDLIILLCVFLCLMHFNIFSKSKLFFEQNFLHSSIKAMFVAL